MRFIHTRGVDLCLAVRCARFGTAGSGDITAMFIYAVIVTATVVIVTYRLTRFSERMKKKNEK